MASRTSRAAASGAASPRVIARPATTAVPDTVIWGVSPGGCVKATLRRVVSLPSASRTRSVAGRYPTYSRSGRPSTSTSSSASRRGASGFACPVSANVVPFATAGEARLDVDLHLVGQRREERQADLELLDVVHSLRRPVVEIEFAVDELDVVERELRRRLAGRREPAVEEIRDVVASPAPRARRRRWGRRMRSASTTGARCHSEAMETSASIASTVSRGLPSGWSTASRWTVAASANGRISTRSTRTGRASTSPSRFAIWSRAMPGATR